MSDPLRLVHRNVSRIIHDLAKHIYTITRPHCLDDLDRPRLGR